MTPEESDQYYAPIDTRAAALAAIVRAAREAQLLEAEQHAAYFRAKLTEDMAAPWSVTDDDRAWLSRMRIASV